MKFKHELIIRLLRIVLSILEVIENCLILIFTIIELFIFPLFNYDNDESNNIKFVFSDFRFRLSSTNIDLYLYIQQLECEYNSKKLTIIHEYNLHGINKKDIILIIAVGIGFFITLYLLKNL